MRLNMNILMMCVGFLFFTATTNGDKGSKKSTQPASSTVSTGGDECGKIDETKCGKNLASRIFGGNETRDIGCIPWQAALVKLKDDNKTFSQTCGGSIISSKLVVTAAHCVLIDDPEKTGQYTPLEEVIKIMKVSVGVTNLNDLHMTEILDIQEIHVHPDYIPIDPPSSYLMENDYAILKLTKDIDLGQNSKAKAVCLPTKEDVASFEKNGTILSTSGWGQGNGPDGKLMDIKIPYVLLSSAKSAFEKRRSDSDIQHLIQLEKKNNPTATEDDIFEHFLNKIVNPSLIWAGSTDGLESDWEKDPRTCYGDSGGPLTWKDPKNKKIKLIGITSFSLAGMDNTTCQKYGIPEKHLNLPEPGCCLPGYPVAWAKVTLMLDGIKKAMKGDFSKFTKDTPQKPSTPKPPAPETTTPESTGSITFAGKFLTIGMAIMSYMAVSASKKICLIG